MSHCSRRSSIVNLTALDMVQSIRGKEISCREVMEAHIEQIEDINPKVNAIVTLDVDKACELPLVPRYIRIMSLTIVR